MSTKAIKFDCYSKKTPKGRATVQRDSAFQNFSTTTGDVLYSLQAAFPLECEYNTSPAAPKHNEERMDEQIKKSAW